ncbi:MAG TPA: helix-hairpin-helix domain-containing protein [Phaeodactylibacter sp.]|nr:helix-hairpin-helix domain-containing protein [Phaeodactylibacter sp.]
MLKKQYLKSKPVCKVTFSLPAFAAEGAQEVKVLGDFNDWSWENGITMKAKKDEYQAVAELEAGRDYQFRYLIDKTYWENDHQADAYVPSGVQGVENSVVVVEAATTTAKPAKAKPAKKAAPKKATAKAKAAPKKKTAKKAAGKDDLKKIEGIGPKIAGLFADAGITTFEGLATAKKSQLKEILEAAGPRYKMHDPTTWTKQAKLAAAGKWDELDKLQQELKGGKRKKK